MLQISCCLVQAPEQRVVDVIFTFKEETDMLVKKAVFLALSFWLTCAQAISEESNLPCRIVSEKGCPIKIHYAVAKPLGGEEPRLLALLENTSSKPIVELLVKWTITTVRGHKSVERYHKRYEGSESSFSAGEVLPIHHRNLHPERRAQWEAIIKDPRYAWAREKEVEVKIEFVKHTDGSIWKSAEFDERTLQVIDNQIKLAKTRQK